MSPVPPEPVRPEPDLDVAIVGAGLSGISMGTHLQMMRPGTRFAILERREAIGGTWDLFRYPGIRSDSDMHTLGFRFAPWRDEKTIASGEDIRAYLEKVAGEYALREHLRCGTTVISADWRADTGLWHLVVEDAQGWRDLSCRFLYLASGYYDYDEPHEAEIPGLADFAGTVVHPQFWPADLDYAGRRVVVIGSGATAVTLVPAMARRAAHVTMLQRTPTWIAAQPSVDPLAKTLRKWLPEPFATRLTRFITIRLHSLFFHRSRKRPETVANYLRGSLRRALGDQYDPRHFEPPYPPWDQRLCLAPDGDFMEAVKGGSASVVTEKIAGFDRDAVLLESGERLPADIVVTATGLKLAIGGKIAISMDGQPVDWTRRWFYRSCMFSNVPNFAVVFGYLNTSWTLRADNTADYVCRLLDHMDATGSDIAVPVLEDEASLEEDDIIIFSSGYLQRARPLMPKSAARLPWRLNQDYLEDCRHLRQVPVADSIMRFEALARTEEIA